MVMDFVDGRKYSLAAKKNLIPFGAKTKGGK
jgi:hypothetical protein